MFANQRRGTVGLGSIGAVAAIMVAWLIGTGVLIKTYREGGASRLPANSTCELVCQSAPAPAKG
ncbi:MAG: hypothetical protein Q8L48_04165 [Archangium sp.]|nr:hypothetical protein [Archangium sp.]